MSSVFQIAHDYVDALAALDPSTATSLGIPGHERDMTDYSPDGLAAIAALNRRTLSALGAPSPPLPRTGEGAGVRERIARDVMAERLSVRLELFDAGEHLRGLNIITSPLQGVRGLFDQMPKATDDDWSNIAARLKLVPAALAGYRRTLEAGLSRGTPASQRQARECALQADIWSGRVAGKQSSFDMLLAQREASDGLQADLEDGVRAAKDGYAETGRWLRDEYLPKANPREAAGPERYEMMSRVFLGATIDPREAYEWGWQEFYRLEGEMQATAEKILPGATVQEAIKLLETDPDRSLHSPEAFQSWLQEVHDEAIEAVDGAHFDIDRRIRRCEVMIPPPGGVLAPYYSGPSEDFTRPGRTWWPLGSRTHFPKWGEVSTAYHEGVPGHHLQVGSARVLGDKLSRFQKLLTFVSGYGEGWALYAERLMGELGFLENPDYYLGMLNGQIMRAVRVIVDIGMHLEMKIPASERFHPGEVWDHDLALEFAKERTGWPAEMLASEIVRYLGWPAQAISYKLGERKWLEVRERAKKKMGADFNLKRFHTDALDLGPMGLAQLEREIA